MNIVTPGVLLLREAATETSRGGMEEPCVAADIAAKFHELAGAVMAVDDRAP
ncbi:hypothetical protein [Pseudoroseomonas ludipueritiae]|uniref:Uncharacterized protein n=1 Tax=Pseudoroseomonas ludipueritiae TaxID=198093 RepID=A0ABR7R1X2_9PROT|nr:hypothetical protein [Pseudoroseomonas ludipueritiae]MBC9175734.1 hypothetical protein [Pseudoroseomonas ludipueritiae]MCG7361500.1 hypothetical protein [Roseomonas sp. ACRSG]